MRLFAAAACLTAALLFAPVVWAQSRDNLSNYEVMIEDLRAQGLVGCSDEDIDPGSGGFAALYKSFALPVTCAVHRAGFPHLGPDEPRIGLERVRDHVWKLTYGSSSSTPEERVAYRDAALRFLSTLRAHDPSIVEAAERAVLAGQPLSGRTNAGEVLMIDVYARCVSQSRFCSLNITATNQSVTPDRRTRLDDASGLIAAGIGAFLVGAAFIRHFSAKAARDGRLSPVDQVIALIAMLAVVGALAVAALAPFG